MDFALYEKVLNGGADNAEILEKEFGVETMIAIRCGLYLFAHGYKNPDEIRTVWRTGKSRIAILRKSKNWIK